MKTFSVEGTSTLSIEGAMADAMARAGQMAAGADHIDIAIASATKDKDGNFHVVISVRAHDVADDVNLEEDEGSGEEGRGKDNRYHARRAEEISQQVSEELLHQFHLHTYLPDMSEAEESARQLIIDATPDTVEYAQSMADNYDGSSGAQGRDRGSDSAFDVVMESADAASESVESGSRITMLSREVDEVIGLLSLGFYNPPQPESGPAATETVVVKGPEEARERERLARLEDEGAPMPTQPPVDMRPGPLA